MDASVLIYVLEITGHRCAQHHGLDLAFVEFRSKNDVGFSDPRAYFFKKNVFWHQTVTVKMKWIKAVQSSGLYLLTQGHIGEKMKFCFYLPGAFLLSECQEMSNLVWFCFFCFVPVNNFLCVFLRELELKPSPGKVKLYVAFSLKASWRTPKEKSS